MKHTSLLEKLGLALLIFGWLTYGSIFLGDYLVHAEEDGIDALRIVSADTGDDATEETEVAAVDFATLLASADAGKGQKVSKKCGSCHTFDEGGANKLGPNLWGIVGRTQGSVEGFGYSGAFAGLSGTWTAEELFVFLENPGNYVAGTKMSLKIKSSEKRANLIAYLMSQGG